jgi:hypothetical protein
MAKSAVSAEQLEVILSTVLSKTLPEIMAKTLEKFESQIDRLIARVEARFDEKVDKICGDLFSANSRIDALEAKLVQHQAACSAQPVQPLASNVAATGVEKIVELTTQALITMEKEKEETKLRSRNVIVTGIPSSPTVSDKDLFETFCEEHLTIKPRVTHSRRIGKDKVKLCVSLESAEAVDDLIDSSSLLRNATDQRARQTYFNRDLTKRQAQEAYNKRCLATEKRLHQNPAAASSLNPQASSFRSDVN